MSVVINPSSTLGFNRPLTTHVKRQLSITNHNAQPVAFKVKTTAPKLYCVRPNSGRVDPGETVEVQVMLQAMKDEPPLSTKCKDKFLIQSTPITPEKEALPLAEIWNTESPEDIHSQKIRVVYLPPEGQTVPEEDESHANMSSMLNQPSMYDTARHVQPSNGHAVPPIPEFPPADSSATVPQPEPEIHVDAPSTPPSAVTDVVAQQEQEEPLQDESESPAIVNVNVHTPSPSTPPSAHVPAPVSDPNPELLAKLSEAQAEIERLRNLISSMPDPSTVPPTVITSSSELRRRNRALSDDGSTLSPETEIGSYVDEGMVQPEGVPLQVVIIIALGVFVTTYLFF